MDRAFQSATAFFAFLVLVILGGVFLSLVLGSLPALSAFGLSFTYTLGWNPVTEQFGALAPIYGTLVTALIAMAVGIPISFGIAVFLTELAPPWLKQPVGIAIELLAGIPSIIYGIWGLFVFALIFQQTLQPFLIDTVGELPLIGRLFGGPPYGIGIFTAGLILGIMVLPFITAIMRDVFETVPPMVKESAMGWGRRPGKWSGRWSALYPRRRHRRHHAWAGAGAWGNHGRHLRDRQRAPYRQDAMAPGTTISAAIANEFNEAVGDLYISSLIALGLILFFITFTVLALAKFMLMRMQKRAGG